MVVKRCPTCRGAGVVELAPPSRHKAGYKLAQVDVRKVLDLLREGLSYAEVGRRTGIHGETVKVIGNGTWAGYRKIQRPETKS